MRVKVSGIRPLMWMRKLRRRILSSLGVRVVVITVGLAFIVALILSAVLMSSVRSTLVQQLQSQSRADFSAQITQASNAIDSISCSSDSECQQAVNSLASSLQSEGPSNLVGVYLSPQSSSGHDLIPVSTEPSYKSLISDAMQSAVALESQEKELFYQPVTIRGAQDEPVPAAMLGTVLEFAVVGDLRFYALYSYESEQQSLENIQLNLLYVCILLSVLLGLVILAVLHSIIGPIGRVAQAAERFADGELNERVVVNRTDEIGTLQSSFNEMADALSQKIKELEESSNSQKRFVSDVSHELRTPVTTIRMASDVLVERKDDFDPLSRRTVELLSEQTERFQELLSDLLEISRYDAGYAALDLQDSDLREIANEACRQISGLAQVKGVSVRVFSPDAPVKACVDERRITRIVRNLLANAVDFAETRPVDVKFAANARCVVISVRDYGVGMDEETVSHAFDRFWRADTARSRITGGTGLGLSISLADAQLHRGNIAVRSRPGAGTWFLVGLPRDPGADAPCGEDWPVRFVGEGSVLQVEGAFLPCGTTDIQEERMTA